MSKKYGAILVTSIAAALTAVVLSCAAPPAGVPDYFVIKQRGVPVGWLELAAAGLRRDAQGPFYVTACRLQLRRWADGRGVLEERMNLVAARRPGGVAYCVAGRWPGGEFRYRAGDSWRLSITDEFGRVAVRRGSRIPSFVSFLGVPLPVATSRPGSALEGLELTDGRVSSFRGRGSGDVWIGRGPTGYARVTFTDNGAVSTYADDAGLTVAPAAAAPRVTGVRHEKPRALLLSCLAPPGPGGRLITLPLAVRLSAPTAPAELERPGQRFEGDVSGDALTGTFLLEPSSQMPLEAPPPAFAAAGPGPGPELLGGKELERMAAWYRARGESVRFVTGAGLFAGNLLAPYSWLEVEGRSVAAPGLALPYCRVVFAAGDEPVALTYLALTGEPEAKGAGCRAVAALPATLEDGAKLSYDVYRGGARAGELLAWYDAPKGETPAVLLDGNAAGLPLRDAAFYEPVLPGRLREMRESPPSVAEIFVLGAAVAVGAEGDEPPYELCFSVASDTGPAFARGRWEGVRAVVAGGERRLCRVYRLSPGPYTAYYTYDGLLARLEWGRYAVQLESYPTKRKRPAVAEAAAQPSAASRSEPPPPTEGDEV